MKTKLIINRFLTVFVFFPTHILAYLILYPSLFFILYWILTGTPLHRDINKVVDRIQDKYNCRE